MKYGFRLPIRKWSRPFASLLVILAAMSSLASAATLNLECDELQSNLAGQVEVCPQDCMPPFYLSVNMDDGAIGMTGTSWEHYRIFIATIADSDITWSSPDWLYDLNRYTGRLIQSPGHGGMVNITYDWHCTRVQRQF